MEKLTDLKESFKIHGESCRQISVFTYIHIFFCIVGLDAFTFCKPLYHTASVDLPFEKISLNQMMFSARFGR